MDRRCLLQRLAFSESRHFSWDTFPPIPWPMTLHGAAPIDGEDDGNNSELCQRPLLPPLFMRCQNFGKRCQTFGRTLFVHNFSGTLRRMRDRTCLFLLHFWTDLIGLRKNVPCPFSNGPKLTKLKITKVLLASRKKTLNKMRKAMAELVSWQN
jgi:hypothetical protein